jgi:hypothetical protein
MKELHDNKDTFSSSDSILCITDVHFHKSYWPARRHKDVKHYFSEKHYNCGLKVATGLLIHAFNHIPGNTHDFTIFKDNILIYEKILKKRTNEKDLEDDGALQEQYSNQWIMIEDSAYISGDGHVQFLYVKKCTQQASQKRSKYAKLSANQVKIENWYGRMLNNFEIIWKTYTYEYNHYDKLFSVAASLTNYSVLQQPLHNEEGKYYQQKMHQYAEDGKKCK